MSNSEERLKALGLVLPTPTAPVANYIPYVRSGNHVHISGQLSNDGNGRIKGTLGVDVSVEEGIEAARLCGLNLLAQMKAAAGGDLDNIIRVVKLNGFVQAGPDFYDIPKIMNGCSDLMVEVLGDAGRHARSAVGMYKIPLGFAVEVDAFIEVADRR